MPEARTKTPGLLSDKELWSVAHRMWIGLTTKPIKKRYGQGVSSGFEGRSAVQWLITALEINGEIQHQKRKLGTLYGQQMLDAGYIIPLKGKLGVKQLLRLTRVDDTAFEDSKRTYQFNPVAVCKETLSVAIFRAGGLLGRNKKGMCDPVVYVKLGTQQKNTRIIEKTQEPIWNETFSLGIKNMEAQHLEIEVYDCSSVYGLSFLGCVHIPLRRMLQDSKPNISVGAKKSLLSSTLFKSPSLPGGGVVLPKHFGATPDGNARTASSLVHTSYFSKDSISTYKLQDGVRGSKISSRINGFIEVGFVVEKKDFTDKPTNQFRRRHLNKDIVSQLNVNIKRVRNAKEVGIMHLGKLVPGLKWLNRVEIRVEDKKVASSYVPKKTGPTFNELLSIDLTSAQMKSPTSQLLVTVFQCGQLRDPGNPIGEVVLPLHQITNTEKTKWYPLANKKENGEIQMSCFFKKKKALNALGIEQLDDTVMRASLPCNDHLEVGNLKHILAHSMIHAPYAYIVRGIWHSNEFLETFYRKRKFKLLSNISEIEWDNITKRHVDDICLEHFVGLSPPKSSLSEQDIGKMGGNPTGLEHLESMENTVCRKISYIVPGNSLIGALEGNETQYIVVQTETLTVVRCISQTLKAPYGDRFEVWNQYAFKWIEPRVTNITISHKTRWVGEKPWIATNVERAILDGTKEAAEQFVELLKNCVSEKDDGSTTNRSNTNSMPWIKSLVKLAFVFVSVAIALIAILNGKK